jgi:c-di-AMP phosphodiesterase-like protein
MKLFDDPEIAMVVSKFTDKHPYQFGNLMIFLKNNYGDRQICFFDADNISYIDMPTRDFLDAIRNRNDNNTITLPLSGVSGGWTDSIKLLQPGDQYGLDIDWDLVENTFTDMSHLLVKSAGKY